MPNFYLRLEINTVRLRASILSWNYGETVLKDRYDVIFKDLPVDLDVFSLAFEKVSAHMDIGLCSQAVIFISPLFVSFRTLFFPFRSENKIRQAISFELEPLLPQGIESYISDFHSFQKSADSNYILSASVSEERVQSYFAGLRKHNIKPVMISPAGYANAVGYLIHHNDVVSLNFVYVGQDFVSITLVRQRTPVCVRSLLNKRTSPQEIVSHLRQTIKGFQFRINEPAASETILCIEEDVVGAVDFKETFYKILDNTSMGIDLPEAFSKHELDKNTNSERLLSMFRPGGTSRYLFNFCQGKYAATSFIKTNASDIAASALLLVCALVLLVLNTGITNSRLISQIEKIDQQAMDIFKQTFPDRKRIYDPYLQMTANVKETLGKKDNLNRGVLEANNDHVSLIQILSQLSDKLPSSMDIDISKFLYANSRLILSGTTDTFNTVDSIKGKMESLELFKTITLSGAIADQKNANRIIFNFIIEM